MLMYVSMKTFSSDKHYEKLVWSEFGKNWDFMFEHLI